MQRLIGIGRWRRVVEADDHLVPFDGDAVAADAQRRVDEAPARGDVEVPLVPRAADERALRAAHRHAVAEPDAADGRGRSSTAARRGAGSGRRARGARRRRGTRPTRWPPTSIMRTSPGSGSSARRIRASGRLMPAPRVLRSKKRTALPCATASRQSAGSRLQRLARVVEVPVRVVAREAQRALGLQALDRGREHPVLGRLLERLRGPREWSCTYSDGGRTQYGTSVRQPRQAVSSRHSRPTNGTRPPSMNITRVRGNRSKMPWQRIEAKCPNIPAPVSAWYSV